MGRDLSGDEYFEYPGYTGDWDWCRWRICGLDLPDAALKKIYHANAEQLIPGLS